MDFLFGPLPEAPQDWQWLPMLAARLAVGVLFVISGFGKLATGQKRQSMQETLHKAGVPMPRFNAVFVSLVELVGGGLLVLGLLTPLACILLIINMLVAIATVVAPEWKGSLAGWLGQFLYLPEVMYIVILAWLLLAGPGWMSLDYFIREQAGIG